MTNTNDIFAFLTKIYLKSTRSDDILLRSSPDSTDSAEYWLGLAELGEISALAAKLETDGLELDDPTINTGWFRC